MRHSWPGNVRQLENVVRRFLILPDLQEALSELEDTKVPLPQSQPDASASTSLKQLAGDAADKAAKELVFNTLNEVNWNRKEAARRLNICYKSLLNKLHRWQLTDRDEAMTRNGPGREAQVAVIELGLEPDPARLDFREEHAAASVTREPPRHHAPPRRRLRRS